jgi:uncharacterized lipoprotein NlpE involved in copper resistance
MNDTRKRIAIVAGVLALGGCANAATGHSQTASLASDGSAQTPRVYSPAQVAMHLLNEARVPADAVRSTLAPTTSLAQPPDGLDASNVTVRAHWWRIKESAAATYAWVVRHQSAALSSAGSSSTGGPALSDVLNDADFTPAHLPTTINSAQLSIAVVPLSAHTSAIGAFATVVRQPPRPKIEDVPPSVDAVVVITRRTSGEPDGGALLSRKTVTGAAARQLVADFDALPVQAPHGPIPCPMSQYTQTATFSADGHVWTATAGVCIGVAVNLDGHPLPTLESSDAFTRDLHAAYGHQFPSVLGPQPMTHSSAAQSTVNS